MGKFQFSLLGISTQNMKEFTNNIVGMNANNFAICSFGVVRYNSDDFDFLKSVTIPNDSGFFMH